ncbi:MAG: SufS family cysteine desulfurase [Mobilitalea sp.]
MIMHSREGLFNSNFPPKEITSYETSYSDNNVNRIIELANDDNQSNFNPDFFKQFNTVRPIAHTNFAYGICPECNEMADYYFLKNDKPKPPPSGQVAPYWISSFDVQSIRKDFPILHRKVNGNSLIWLDNGATTQKPLEVINSLNQYYSQYNSNIHRGAHTLAKYATEAYEGAREKVRNFIGAAQAEEIIFTRGSTESINLIAETFGQMNIHEGDEILLSMMEHHSNIVPWQKLQEERGAVIKVIPINECGEVLLEEYNKLLTPRTKIVGITHVSNVLGTINPVKTMIEMAHNHGACVMIDGAQSVPHLVIDVKELDADFYVFSGHKMYGPTGIGILYAKKALLEQMPPWQRGGGMINNVSFSNTTYNHLPYKFEAGTGNIADAIALGAAIDYLKRIGMSKIEEHERKLTLYTIERLKQIPNVHLIGTAPGKISVISFIIDGISPESVAQYLNREGIAVRAGHHCAQPVLSRFGLTSSVRASLGVYNTKEEVDCLANAVLKIAKLYN